MLHDRCKLYLRTLMCSFSFFEIAYRQKAHLVGVPDFKWLEKYQLNIGRKSFLNTGEDDALI